MNNDMVREKIKRKLEILRRRELHAIAKMDHAECLKLEGAIFHVEDLYALCLRPPQSKVEVKNE